MIMPRTVKGLRARVRQLEADLELAREVNDTRERKVCALRNALVDLLDDDIRLIANELAADQVADHEVDKHD